MCKMLFASLWFSLHSYTGYSSYGVRQVYQGSSSLQSLGIKHTLRFKSYKTRALDVDLCTYLCRTNRFTCLECVFSVFFFFKWPRLRRSMLKLSENNSQGFLIPESFKLRVCNLSLQMCYVNGFSEQKLVTLARHT